MSTTNARYRERFPRATAEMESSLTVFLESIGANNDATGGEASGCDATESKRASLPQVEQFHSAAEKTLLTASPVLRFAAAQLAEIARDCLQRSREGVLSSRYFTQMNENLENLLNEVRLVTGLQRVMHSTREEEPRRAERNAHD